MLSRAALHILALIIAMQTLSGCSGQSGTANNSNAAVAANAENANRSIEPGMEGARDNAEELATLIKMPYSPEDLAWKEMPSPNGRRLVAVFQLTGEDAQKLVDNASKVRPASPVSVTPEKWFPKELTTQHELTGESGVPATAYAADEFLHPPFTEGSVSRVNDTDFFVLEVFAK